MTKKKFLNTYYIALLGVLFVIVLGLFSSCYAVTEEYFNDFVDTSKEFFIEKFGSVNETYYAKIYNEYSIFADYDNLAIVAQNNGWFFVFGFNSDEVKAYKTNSTSINFGLVSGTDPKTIVVANISRTVSRNVRDVTSGGYSFSDVVLNQTIDCPIYSSNNSDTTYIFDTIYYYSPLPQNTITLTATSNHKFGFNDKNQCLVNLTGDYEIGDFTFYVEKLINNEWYRQTSGSDWYYLSGYENPYYIIWHNINYFSLGTYRYCADYGNMGESIFYSNTFEIYSSAIENEGTATGTIDTDTGNVNIDVNIDTGQTVDNIKDFLGQPTDISEDQFSDNFPEVEVEDPTSDFFTWFFEQIQSCFTVSTAQYLIFTLYDEQFRINSDDYILNIPILKTVIGTGSSIFIFYGIFLDIRKEIEKVKEGKFSEIGKDDITASMM